MDINIAKAFLRNAPIAYDPADNHFFDSSKVQKAVFFRLSTFIQQPSQIGDLFLSEIGQDCTSDNLEWMQISDNLISKLEDISNPKAIETIQKIRSAQNVFKQNQQKLHADSPMFLKDDEEFVLNSLEQDPTTYKFCSLRLKSKLYIALKALEGWPEGLRYLPEELRQNKECAIKAVSQNGLCLKVCLPLLKADEDVVFAAVCQNPSALRYVDLELAEDSYFLTKVLLSKPKAYCFIPEKPYTDLEFQTLALKTIDDREKLKIFIQNYANPDLRAFLVEKILISSNPRTNEDGLPINILEGVNDITSLTTITPILCKIVTSSWKPELMAIPSEEVPELHQAALSYNAELLSDFQTKIRFIDSAVNFHKQSFKDGIKRQCLLEILIALDKSFLDATLKLKFLVNCLEEGIAVEELLKRMKLLATCLKLLDYDTIELLNDFSSSNLTELIIHKLVEKNYLSAAQVPAFLDKFQKSRHPAAIFTYLKNQEAHEDTLEVIKSFIESVISENFTNMRHLNNSYKKLLSDSSPSALSKWEEELCLKFDENLYALDSEQWQDLFFAGTDVIGSCQNVSAGTEFSKCLMGYVTDGKIRILCIKNHPNGPIVARAMMKIMKTPDGGPAIFIEKIYPNHGNIYKDRIIELAKQKALNLGLEDDLYEACEDALAQEHVILQSDILNPGLWEYEDAACEQPVTNGVYSVKAKKIL